MDELTTTRLTNVVEYAEFGCWQELEHFSGGLLDLYALGLPCRILNVEISVSASSVDALEPALSNARPSRLTIRFWDRRMFDGYAPGLEFPSHLRIPGMAEVRTMKLEITTAGPKRGLDLDPFLVGYNNFVSICCSVADPATGASIRRPFATRTARVHPLRRIPQVQRQAPNHRV